MEVGRVKREGEEDGGQPTNQRARHIDGQRE